MGHVAVLRPIFFWVSHVSESCHIWERHFPVCCPNISWSRRISNITYPHIHISVNMHPYLYFCQPASVFIFLSTCIRIYISVNMYPYSCFPWNLYPYSCFLLVYVRMIWWCVGSVVCVSICVCASVCAWMCVQERVHVCGVLTHAQIRTHTSSKSCHSVLQYVFRVRCSVLKCVSTVCCTVHSQCVAVCLRLSDTVYSRCIVVCCSGVSQCGGGAGSCCCLTQCVVVCIRSVYDAMWCVAVCIHIVLQCACCCPTVCCSVYSHHCSMLRCVAVCFHSVMQYVCCHPTQCVAVCIHSVLHCVAVCIYIMLQCVCCCPTQCFAVCIFLLVCVGFHLLDLDVYALLFFDIHVYVVAQNIYMYVCIYTYKSTYIYTYIYIYIWIYIYICIYT